MSYHCSISDPFVRMSRTLADKLQTGIINKDEFAVLTYMMLKADLKTGQLITKSTLLAEEMGIDRVNMRNILGSLKNKGFIQNPDSSKSELSQKRGSTKSYPIYICDYPVIEPLVRAKTEDSQSHVRDRDRAISEAKPQIVDTIEVDGNLAKKPKVIYNIRSATDKKEEKKGSISSSAAGYEKEWKEAIKEQGNTKLPGQIAFNALIRIFQQHPEIFGKVTADYEDTANDICCRLSLENGWRILYPAEKADSPLAWIRKMGNKRGKEWSI